ncbi:type IIL restriction-modification enzyme MmeI [Gardnerella pickettii]|nr:type IIL restriction-modification enzyme MmeI [Gardnerella pickettii]KXA15554.1 hypothetical protein HMPREF3204_01058 [Gardnerella pickettii]
MNIADQHKKAAEFIERWQGRGDEKQETQKFWLDFMQNVLDVPNAINNTEFEYRTAGGGYIDMLCTDSRFLVEQKSKNVDLDKPEERQGTLVTPAEQAVRYSDNLPLSKKPTFICTCNFNTFRFYDLEKDPRAQKSPVEEFTLDKLAEHLTVFRNIFSENRSRNYIEKQLSEKAGLLVANLHNELEKQYVDPNSEKEHHSLALITVRIVFCLYAEDAGLFTNHIFSNYIHNAQSSDLRRKLIDLFNTLDTKEKDRDKYLEDELQQFPYVNGGLFRENIEIPQLTESIKNAILHAGDDFDWHTISPVIFGSLMEETLSHDQRRKGGMHYTTVKNIHRLIDPLFLDDLTNELTKIETDQKISRKIRKSQLEKYQDKLASLQFLELTYDIVKYYQFVHLYLVTKTGNKSNIKLCEKRDPIKPSEMMNYNPIQNSYSALWSEYKIVNEPIHIINIIRRILEYYFLQICGYDGFTLKSIMLNKSKDMFITTTSSNIEDYSYYHLASAMLAYIQTRESVSIIDGINYVENSFNVEQVRKTFEMIFNCMVQGQHYAMMMNINTDDEI